MNTAYLLFREKNWTPSQYYDLPYGERVVVRAFLAQEYKERKKEAEELEKVT